MNCGAKFKIIVKDPTNDFEVWSSDEEFKHDSDTCEKCMASELKFSVYDSCEENNFLNGLIIFNGKIDNKDFFKIYQISQNLVNEIRSNGKYKCSIKKVECVCESEDYIPANYFIYKSCKENLYFYVDDDFEYDTSPSGLSDTEQQVYNLKSQIIGSGFSPSDSAPLVSPATIALILLDELNRLDGWDTLQELQGNFPLIVDREQSYGMSQMYPETLADLIDSGHYPPVSGYNGDADGFFDKRALYLEIMEDKNSPKLIAAFIKKSIDHWAKGTDGTNSKLSDGKNPADEGFDISELPHVLATLYAKGYNLPVHDNPGGLENRWDNHANTISMLYTINKKMGIPTAPARFLDITPLSNDGSSFMCLEYQEKIINAKINKLNTSEFIDSKGRKSRYLSPYSVASDPMFRRTQSMCKMCK